MELTLTRLKKCSPLTTQVYHNTHSKASCNEFYAVKMVFAI